MWNIHTFSIFLFQNCILQISASKKQETESQTKTDQAKSSPSDLNLDETSIGQEDTKIFPFKNSGSYEVS